MIVPIILLAFATISTAVPKPNTLRDIYPSYPQISIPIPPGFEAPTERIVGGEIADPHNFPHQAALFLHKAAKTNFCGGSLISTKYVLTAAHCTESAISIDVVLGAHNIRDENEPTQTFITAVSYIIHENYNPTAIINDISIITLPDEAVAISDIIQLVHLPSWSDVGKDLTGENAVVSGWGKINDGETSYTDYLQFVEFPIITNEDCDVWYFGGTIHDVHICTSGEDARSTCNGDSGGALVVNGKQVGIVSFGILFGCEAGWPAAYTRVSQFLQWIEDNSDVIIEP
ncbi:brachyurin-like [Onthophagus taurus]|uniref:brachyurin-like n=1 Tax=Onthophagus taurus TaxID=166361 RepID=UPI0039BE0661